MLFERIVSKGLAHYSYLLGDKSDAIVIDPRRDCEIYIEKAAVEGMRIRHILETHRNEDYVIGSVELARRTGAEIWHADSHLDYKYGMCLARHITGTISTTNCIYYSINKLPTRVCAMKGQIINFKTRTAN